MAEKPKSESKKSKIKAQDIKGVLPPSFPLGPEKFENESSPEAVERSEAKSEAEVDREEESLDKLLEGDDRALDDLEY